MNHAHQHNVEYKLVGTEVSLFTAKARAYLDWKGVHYKPVLASDDVYRTIIKPYTGVEKIPVLLIIQKRSDGSISKLETVQDTKAIIDYFEDQPTVGPPRDCCGWQEVRVYLGPKSPQKAFAAGIFQLLADEWLVNQAMLWRWGDGNYKKDDFAEQLKFLEFEFGNTATAGVRTTSYQKTCAIGRKRLDKFKKSLPGLGVSPATSGVFRSNFLELLSRMSKHFEIHPFILGEQVSVADFAFYGSFYAHLGRDPIPASIIKTQAPLVWEWIERVGGKGRWANRNVERWESDKRRFYEDYAEIVVSDSEKRGVAKSAAPIAQLLMDDYVLVLEDTIKRGIAYIEERRRENEKARETSKIQLPRTIGEHEFRISSGTGYTATGTRNVRTHPLWNFQRILDRHYKTPDQRGAADAWINEVGGHEMGSKFRSCVAEWEKAGWWVGREKNRLIVVKSSSPDKAHL